MSTIDYFNREMRRLHETGQAFANKYPEQARLLNLNDLQNKDPSVERLLEGVAFLTAQLREHIDANVPEFSEALLEQLWPEMLRPFPCATIMQLTPRFGLLNETVCLEKGVSFMPAPNAQVDCRFVSTSRVKINPIHIKKIGLQKSHVSGAKIEILLQTMPNISFDTLDMSDLTFYLHMDFGIACDLHRAFTQELNYTLLKFQNAVRPEEQIVKDAFSIKPGHLAMEDAMLTSCARSSPGVALLHDYFSFKEKYLFVKLVGLERVHWPSHCQSVTLEIATYLQFPHNFELPNDSFRLHCVPAINLYSAEAEPIMLNHQRVEYPIVIHSNKNTEKTLYSVDAVTGVNMQTGEKMKFHDFHSFEKKGKGAWFRVNWRHGANDDNPPALVVGDLQNYENQMLSCKVSVCDGDYPTKHLMESDLSRIDKTHNFPIEVANLTKPKPFTRPPSYKDYQWQLIAHLGLNYQKLNSDCKLKQLLNLYDWSHHNENKINSILGVEQIAIRKIIKGIVYHGVEFKLILDEQHYSSKGELHLFTLVWHHFFTHYAELNQFVQTRIVLNVENDSWLLAPNFS